MFLGTWRPRPADAEDETDEDARVKLELAAIGRRGGEISAAREMALNILSAGSGCALWFEQAHADPAGVFRTLHYRVEERSRPYIDSIVDDDGVRLYKHPWAATSYQGSGAYSTIVLNANGAFFQRSTQVMNLDTAGNFVGPGDRRSLVVARYPGASMEAQVVTLLHELGHIIGLLPEDSNSWDGHSSRNTQEVLGHCKAEIRGAARRMPWSRAGVAKNR